jgi:hypothetical protein
MNKQQTETFETTRRTLATQLRELGASVMEAPSDLGDFIVGWKGQNYILRVNNPGGAKRKDIPWNGRKIASVSGLTEACRAMGMTLTIRRDRELESKTAPVRGGKLSRRPTVSAKLARATGARAG